MPKALTAIPPAALSVDEAVQYSRVSRPTLYRLMAAPNSVLKTVKIGSRRVILRESLDALLAAGATIPPSPVQATGCLPSTDAPTGGHRARASTAA
jgi:excisionase family DNA binding protein